MVKGSIFALLLLGSGSIAIAAEGPENAEGGQEASQDQQSAEGGGQATETAQKEKVICRTEKVTGYRAKYNRTCLTKAEWEVRTVREQEELQQMRDQTSPSTRGGGAG